MALPWLRGRKGSLLIVYGDTPLLTTETLKTLVRCPCRLGPTPATFLAMEVPNPTGYGRMVLDTAGFVETDRRA